jgi:hypothetical protein
MLPLHTFHDVVHSVAFNFAVELGDSHICGEYLHSFVKGHRDTVRLYDFNIASDLQGGARIWQDELRETFVGFLSHRDLGQAIFWINIAKNKLVKGVKGALTCHCQTKHSGECSRLQT